MIGSSKNSTENYPRKCFWTQEKETWVKFNPRLSPNRPSNNWALWYLYLSLCMLCFFPTNALPLCSIFHKNSARTNPQDHPLKGCIEEEFDFFIQSTFINCSLSVLYNLFFFSDNKFLFHLCLRKKFREDYTKMLWSMLYVFASLKC